MVCKELGVINCLYILRFLSQGKKTLGSKRRLFKYFMNNKCSDHFFPTFRVLTQPNFFTFYTDISTGPIFFTSICLMQPSKVMENILPLSPIYHFEMSSNCCNKTMFYKFKIHVFSRRNEKRLNLKNICNLNVNKL